ncbi:MAG: tetratricopeptide repeat protein [Candidatus Uhrbacteria bacterium]|nr:tetratricopeptide repeat protein [Candidatus Uhrbacteria bacterium]
MTQISTIYSKIARLALYAIAGLVPLTFFPWTVDPLEVNKQSVLLILTSIAVIAWLGAMVAQKNFLAKKSRLFGLAALFLLSTAISSVMSLAPFTSWVGQNSQEYTSFLSSLVFVLFFVVGSHFLSETKTQRKVWSLMLIVSAVIGFSAILSIAGIQPFSTNFIGSPNALGVYLASMSVLGCGLWLVSKNKSENPVLSSGFWGVISRIAIIVTATSALLVLLALDYWVLWVALLLGLSVIFTFAIVRANEFPETSRFVLPMILFVAAILFLFMPGVLGSRYPVEVSPSYSASLSIAKNTLSDTSWLFGSGPGTFVMDYAKFKSADLNNTAFWDVRFDRSSSHILTLLATFGTVGTLLFVLIILSLAGAALNMLLKKQPHDEWKMTFVAFSSWTVVTVGLLLYSSNMTLMFLFWLFSAVFVSQVGTALTEYAFSKSPRLALLTAIMFVMVTVGLLTVMFVTASRYSAEITFAKAVSADQAGESLDDIIVNLDTAARLNKMSDIYYRNLAHALLLRTAEIVDDPDVSAEVVKAYVGSSINSGKIATELSPANVVNWTLLGDIYREFAPLVGNADTFSIASYKMAVELAPTNPKYYSALGRAYLVRADQLSLLTSSEDATFASDAANARAEALTQAVNTLLTAISLKSDYATAHYYLALAYERQGNLSEAIARMEALSNANPLDIGIGFQLGLLYLQQGKNDLAQTELERIVTIAPSFSNARWYLSAVYEQAGDLDSAIAQVQAIKELNPENTLVTERLAKLEEGNANEELPEPLEEGEEGATDISTGLITE